MIPDGITPVSGWRVWAYHSGMLRSLNGTPWEPLKAMKAECGATVGQQLRSLTLSMLKESQMSRLSNVGGGATFGFAYVQQAPSPSQSLVSAYNTIRWNQRRGHGAPMAPPIIPVYDEDTGERFIPFGQRSRLIVTDFKPPEPPPIQVPNESCSCGIYAAGSRKRAENYMSSVSFSQATSGGVGDPLNQGFTILGRVALWGKVIVHEDGWRAEFGYPQSFFTDENVPGLEAYGATIVPLKDMDRPPESLSKKKGIFG